MVNTTITASVEFDDEPTTDYKMIKNRIHGLLDQQYEHDCTLSRDDSCQSCEEIALELAEAKADLQWYVDNGYANKDGVWIF